MQLFRYKEDRVPTLFITGLFIADLAVYFFIDKIWIVAIWMLLGLGPKACICSWNHHHQHLATFTGKFLNRLLEIVYAFHTGITTNAWVLHHVLGHHINYLDQKKDESGWTRSDGKVMGAFEYTRTIAMTGYTRAFKVGRDHPRYQLPFLSMGMLVTVLLVGFFYNNWINALLVFFIPMLLGYVITCWHTYYHHAGLDTDEHHEASYNIMHKWYNIFTGNLGYHTAHHMKMGLHWSKLPDFHAEIAHKIRPEFYVEPCIPFKWLPSGNTDFKIARVDSEYIEQSQSL